MRGRVQVRAIIVSGEGKSFTSGLDLTDIGLDLMGGGEEGDADVARKAFKIKKHVSMVCRHGHMQALEGGWVEWRVG